MTIHYQKILIRQSIQMFSLILPKGVSTVSLWSLDIPQQTLSSSGFILLYDDHVWGSIEPGPGKFKMVKTKSRHSKPPESGRKHTRTTQHNTPHITAGNTVQCIHPRVIIPRSGQSAFSHISKVKSRPRHKIASSSFFDQSIKTKKWRFSNSNQCPTHERKQRHD